MKKFLLVTIVFAMLFAMIPVVSAAGSVSLKGPEQVRAGDTITVTFYAGGDNIFGGQATVSYDAAQLTLNKYTTSSLGGSWKVENTGDKFVFYDDSLSTPLGGSQAIFKASFTVKDLEPGTEISVSVSGIKLSDENFTDTNFGTKTYTATILPPLSDNCLLDSLTVSNAEISPAFSPEVTGYSASVPFSTSKLEVEATAAHPGATVAIKNTSLTAGATTNVTVTVTAENGTKKTYSIRVKREQDPNYVPSNDATLSQLAAEGFRLSPAFAPEIDQYYVWLPYEAEALALTAQTADSKASVAIGDGTSLVAGQPTRIPVTVTAEDGSTRVYTVTAVRAPIHADTEAYLSGQREPIETDPEPTEPETEPTEAPTEPRPAPQPTQSGSGDLNIVILIGGCAAGLLLGLLLGGLLFRKRAGYFPPEEEDEEYAEPAYMNIPEEETKE